VRGLVKYRRGDGFVELREVKDPSPGPGQITVEVKAAGVCGSDLGILHDHINIPISPPVVIGHECSGVVVAKGRQVGDSVRIGDPVTVEPTFEVCGICRYCRDGYYNLCQHRRILGYTADGCFARFCNATHFHRLPDNVGFKAGAMSELLASAVHGIVEQTGISAGDLVTILGPGPLGLCAAMVAMAEGGVVIVCGTSTDAERLSLARKLGVARTIDVEREDAVEILRSLTEGYGADVVLECAGTQSAAAMGLELVCKRGKYTQMGLFGKPIQVDLERIAFKEINVSGFVSQHFPSWKRALRLMESGKVDTGLLVTHEFGISEWDRAFETMESKRGVKVLIDPG
jgi:L-iditol 2-dehydrogenase